MKLFATGCGLAGLLMLGGCASAPALASMPPGAGKVIIDEDPGELNDDALATAMLLGVDVLGITTVGGNTWPEEGETYARRLLDLLGRTDVPVIRGASADPRTRPNYRAPPYVGALARPRPAAEPTQTDAADFIVEQVKRNPGQVAILAFGPATNLARAVRDHPEIVPLVRRVVLMGGAVVVTKEAEFNWWWDPAAAKVVLDAPFKERVVVPLDATGLAYGRQVFEQVTANHMAPLAKALARLQGAAFASDPARTVPVWDAVAAAVFLRPAIVTEADERRLSADPATGRAVPGQALSQVVTEVDADALWDLYVHRLTALT